VSEAAARDVAAYPHGRVPREVRLRQVLALAEALFAERGYRGASMDELARRVGVSKPVIYDLVGSKDQLFRTLMARTSEELSVRVADAVRTETDPYRRLLAGALAWFGFVADHRPIWHAFLAGDDAPIGAEVAAIRRQQAVLVAELLREAPEVAGVEPGDLLLSAVAHLVNGAFEAVGAWWADHLEVSADAIAELCAQIIFPGLALLGERLPSGWDTPDRS
jgi:AcrR family transcriptional regulator